MHQMKTWDDTKTGMNHTPTIVESPKCDPPNETQKWGCMMQGPGTPDEPHTHFSRFSPEPTTRTNPQIKDPQPAEDSSGTKQYHIPTSYDSRIQIETPKMTTHPNSNPHPMVKCQATPPTTPAQADGTAPCKNKTELPN
ncbi:hypothetical protein BS47DRAFT_1365533 [Hydnum rufescens UP504]|uniref:Uncharacterized protein n=1 Tax=Hydnum rufescens UP504 TaxID=1448309 RepID=A0A9P6ANQ3_9AGAM|nr:hypothetical protein BS47DRAFT_1365533 [Hydnum rufescens UP504]